MLALVVLGLAPVTWIRTGPWQPTDERHVLAVEALRLPAAPLGLVTAAGAWELKSPNIHFGGYSALVALGDGTLLAGSDKGGRLRFTPPDRHGPGPSFAAFAESDTGEKRQADIEALTRDPATGKIWAAFENRNAIARYDAEFRRERQFRPEAMRGWPANGGPEAMVRLADGRFLVLAESGARWFAEESPALLFPGDPADGATPAAFRFRPPAGFRPVDMAELPDGRVLILVRKVLWGIPPRFAGKLVLADPAAIRAGQAWSGQVIADLGPPLPSDNYEGLAIEPAGDGPGPGDDGPGNDSEVVLWLISDDNSVRLQRTLLLKLVWRPNEKARGPAARFINP